MRRESWMDFPYPKLYVTEAIDVGTVMLIPTSVPDGIPVSEYQKWIVEHSIRVTNVGLPESSTANLASSPPPPEGSK